MTKIYTPITEDDTVYTIEEVQVEQAEDVIDKSTMTLAYLDTEISVTNTRMNELQTKLTELQATRIKVHTEAEKVKLKVESAEEPEQI